MQVLPKNTSELFSTSRYLVIAEWLIFTYNIYLVNQDLSELLYNIAQLSVMVGGVTAIFETLKTLLERPDKENASKNISSIINKEI